MLNVKQYGRYAKCLFSIQFISNEPWSQEDVTMYRGIS
jgi:hypothetical protein